MVRKLQVTILKLTQIIYESARNYEKLHFKSDILIWISKIQISQEGFVLLSLLHDPYLNQLKTYLNSITHISQSDLEISQCYMDMF